MTNPTCPKCDVEKHPVHFNAPGVSLGADYTAFLRGICLRCQREHCEAQLDGSLGIVLGGELLKEVGEQLAILRAAERAAIEADRSLHHPL